MEKVCEWCGKEHQGTICPLIKSVEYYVTGEIKKIEFKTASDFYHLTYPLPPTYPQQQQPVHIWPITTSGDVAGK